MRVLMLGWEFPPFITGGLGTACHGLTRGLDQLGVEISFLLPRAIDASEAAHVSLIGPGGSERTANPAEGRAGPAGASPAGFEHMTIVPLPSGLADPYARPSAPPPTPPGPAAPAGATASRLGPAPGASPPVHDAASPTPAAAADHDYGQDLFAQVDGYAKFCAKAAAEQTCDVIHAHDWMTFSAGRAAKAVTGRPLVTHVHSTEFDRSGGLVDPRISEIERNAIHAADRVIAVSQLTKSILVARYDVPAEKVDVVYNGVDLDTTRMGISAIRKKDKIVLYFGRITYQKGPEYFVRAAKRVLEHEPDVTFVVAGSGDQAQRMIEMASEMGIGHRVLFTGFLRGDDIPKVFALADLYVMPSVSEPFGIAPLEAMGHDVPALISRSSGVSEVLTHALKVDFWDVDDMANKIIAVLRHPPLSQTLREHGRMEVRQLTWEGAARKCAAIYERVCNEA